MTNKELLRHKALRSTEARAGQHRYGIDTLVAFRPDGQRDQIYRVIRHMPDGPDGLQYRLRATVGGQERVAGERLLRRPAASDDPFQNNGGA